MRTKEDQPAAPEAKEVCQDCIEAKKAAWSDATTPGFFRPYCPKHAPEAEEEPHARNE
jgi:hypothetical protein